MSRGLLILVAVMAIGLVHSAPNFIVFIADDMGYNDLGVYGSPTIRTPNLDRIAIEGLRLSQFYSVAPICSPSRSAFLTGRYPIRSGVYTYTDYPLDLIFRVFLPSSEGCMSTNETTVAQVLQKHGYYTSLIGKWHLGHNPERGCLPNHRGFEYFYGLPYSHEEGFPGPGLEGVIWPPVPLYHNDDLLEQPVTLTTLTDRYTEQVLTLLDKAAGNHSMEEASEHIRNGSTPTPNPHEGQPFFLYMGYEEPHVPLFASPEFQDVSRRGHYGDSVEEMDSSIGKIMDKLRSTGLDSNTYVIFTSDNGAWIDPSAGLPGSPTTPLDGGSNAPFKGGKGSTWEGGFREPAVVWAPGRVPGGSSSMEVTTMMDLLPTFLDLAGIPPTPGVHIDGKSVKDIWLNPSTARTPYDYLYYWREHTIYAVRQGAFKAHFYTRSGFGDDAPVAHNPPLLFNVEHDPAEAYPLNATDYPALLHNLTQAMVQFNASVIRPPSEYEQQDWSLVPCCNKEFNQTEAEMFWNEGKFGLAIWDACVCNPAGTNRPPALLV